MFKKTIINDTVMYVKMRINGLQSDYYFNRKGCSNRDRGHFVIRDSVLIYDRQAPALRVVMVCGSPFLETSGAINSNSPLWTEK